VPHTTPAFTAMDSRTAQPTPARSYPRFYTHATFGAHHTPRWMLLRSYLVLLDAFVTVLLRLTLCGSGSQHALDAHTRSPTHALRWRYGCGLQLAGYYVTPPFAVTRAVLPVTAPLFVTVCTRCYRAHAFCLKKLHAFTHSRVNHTKKRLPHTFAYHTAFPVIGCRYRFAVATPRTARTVVLVTGSG